LWQPKRSHSSANSLHILGNAFSAIDDQPRLECERDKTAKVNDPPAVELLQRRIALTRTAPPPVWQLRRALQPSDWRPSDAHCRAVHHLVASTPAPLRLNVAAHAKRQYPHKVAFEPAAHRTQLLRMCQCHVVHWSAGEGAGNTRRKADEREQRNALRVAQLRPVKRVEVRLDQRQQRQRLRMHCRLQ